MFSYMWYRHFHFRQEFEKDNRLDDLAEYYVASNLGKIKSKGDSIRKRLRAFSFERSQLVQLRDRLLSEGRLLTDAEFPEVAAKYRRLFILLALIAIGESALNMFTAMIAIPEVGFLAGPVGDVVRLVVAVIVTVIGIVATELFLEHAIPNAASPLTAPAATPSARWTKVTLWGIVLVGVEWMIFHFGWARVADIEGGKINADVAKSIIALSMIVPLIGGGIANEMRPIRSPYTNRLKYDRCSRRIEQAERALEALREEENGYFQEKTNDYWYTYTRVRSFKQFFNSKNGRETAPLTDSRFAGEFKAFYDETLVRYSLHKEKQDAMVKLPAHAIGVGKKLGQDHVVPA